MSSARNACVLLLALVLAGFSADALSTQFAEQDDHDSSTQFSKDLAAAASDDVSDKADHSDDNEDDAKDDDEDDEEDDDEDADDDKSPAASSQQKATQAHPTALKGLLLADTSVTPSGLAKEEGELEKELSRPHAKGQTRLKNEVEKVSKDLDANLREQSELKERVEHLSDEVASDEEIDASAAVVANETDSVALGDMMGHMWKDMRMFEVPSYAKHVEQELGDLKHDQHKLEGKLQASKDKLNVAEGTSSKPVTTEDEQRGPNKAPIEEEENQIETENKKTSENAVVEPQVAPSSTWNFWHMRHHEQESFFAGHLVYIVGGVTLAWIYNRVRQSKTNSILAPRPRTDKMASTKGFTFNLLGCFAAPEVAVPGICCPCMRWADTIDRHTLWRYWKAFAAFFFLLNLHCYSYGLSSIGIIALGVWYRQKLREKYNMENGTGLSIGMDILAWACCQPCAIVQEAREESCQRIATDDV